MIGSATPFRNFGQFADIPENLQAAVESGLSFFELRFQGEKRFTQNVFGFFDVMVIRDTETVRNKVRYRTTWRTGRDAKMSYSCINQKTGLSVALAVDDPFWHNRIMMAFAPTYMIFCLHTPEGQIPGSIITAEIECLREICQEKMKQFCAINVAGKPEFNSFDEKEVTDYIQAKRKPGRMPLRLASRTAWITKPEIEDIIRKNEHADFGWTNSRDFERFIKEPTLMLMQQRNITRTFEAAQPISQEMINEMVAQTLRGMTASQIQALVKAKENKPAVVGEPAATSPYPVAAPEFKTKTFFNRLKLEDARAMAKERGITAWSSMTREKLCAELLADETRRKEEWIRSNTQTVPDSPEPDDPIDIPEDPDMVAG